ncbi:MAG: hypothetical protein IKI99_06510 [Firmicutes bacterium]|nr:hypothetical protein [Bacillota bacterium]
MAGMGAILQQEHIYKPMTADSDSCLQRIRIWNLMMAAVNTGLQHVADEARMMAKLRGAHQT